MGIRKLCAKYVIGQKSDNYTMDISLTISSITLWSNVKIDILIKKSFSF